MTDLRALYQEVILDHNKKPRNFGVIEHPTHDAHGHNPLCGDDFHVYVVTDDTGKIQDVKFDGKGCAISKASASMMTARVKGKTVPEAETLIAEFRGMMVGEASDEELKHLGHLKVFEGVSQLPNRIKCAVLPWHTLHAAISGSEETSTEGDQDEWLDGQESS